MNQASKIEIARKNPPTIRILARQIEALKNDAETVDPRLDQLSEKTKILLKSREASSDELEKINREFLEILEKMQLEHFFERFFASEKIVHYLADNPDKKIENLKPSDFPEIAIMQNPKEWKNILEDAKKGMAVAALLKKKDFDWADPKAYLEKAGDIGKAVVDQFDKHSIMTAVCLIGGIYALYQIFKKDSSLWDKTKGAIGAGVATWLGFSLAGADLHKEAAEQLAVAAVGKKNVDFVKDMLGFGDSKKETGETEEPTRASEIAKDSVEYLAKLMPKSATAVKEFNENFMKFPPDLPASKESFVKIYESVMSEGGNAIFEISKDGIVNLAILGAKGMKEAAVFTWQATPKLINAFSDWLVQPENPWWQQGSGWLIKADKWLMTAGVTVGVTESLFELVRHPTINPFKIVGRVGKGAIKGATVGQYRLAKTAFNSLARPFAFHDFNPKALYKNPQMRMASAIEQWNMQLRSLLPFSNEAKEIFRNIESLQRVKNLMAQANHSFGKKRSKLLGQADEILDKLPFKERVMRGKGINGIGKDHKTLEAAIRRVERITRQQKIALRRTRLSKAKAPFAAPTPKAAAAGAPTPAPTAVPAPTPATPKTPTGKKPKVINLAKQRTQKNNGPTIQLKPTQQIKPQPKVQPKPNSIPKKKPHLQIVPKQSPLPQEDYEKYAKIAKNKGRVPIPAEEMSAKYERVMRAGKGFAKVLGAVGVCLMIQRVAEADDKRKALVETGSEIAVFMGALRVTPGHPVIKILAATAATVGYAILPEDLIEPIQTNISNLMPEWINDPVLDGLWNQLDYWSGGGVIDLVVNTFSLGENPEEFLKRDMPAYFGDWYNPLTWRAGRMRLNNVADWNRRNDAEIKDIAEKIADLEKKMTAKRIHRHNRMVPVTPQIKRQLEQKIQKLKGVITFRNSLRIDKNWDAGRAFELKMLGGAIQQKKEVIDAETAKASVEDQQIVKTFFADKIIETSQKNRSFQSLREFIAKINNPQLRESLSQYAGLRITHDEKLRFAKSIGRYNKNWESVEWIVQQQN